MIFYIYVAVKMKIATKTTNVLSVRVQLKCPETPTYVDFFSLG